MKYQRRATNNENDQPGSDSVSQASNAANLKYTNLLETLRAIWQRNNEKIQIFNKI